MRKEKTTFNGGSLGSCIDEERSKLRYVMWIAEISESSSLWTQLALLGIPRSMSAWVSLQLSFWNSLLLTEKWVDWKVLSWNRSCYLCGFKFVGEGAKGDFCFLPITTWCGIRKKSCANEISFFPKHLVREEKRRCDFLIYSKLIRSKSFLSFLNRRGRKKPKTSTCDLRSGKTTRWT